MPTDTNLPENMLAEIEKIRSQIEERLTAQENIDNALKSEHWDEAYQIAHKLGINLYDPFSTFREAQEAIKQADNSIKKVLEKRGEVKQEIGKIKTDEELWRELESWYLQVIDIQFESLKDPNSTHPKFLKFLGKSSSEYKELLALAERLDKETKYLINIDDDLSKLREIKKILFDEGNIVNENFVWLYRLRLKNPNSQIINRIYAKAEQRFLDQPEPDAGKDYQRDFDEMEKAFRDSKQDDFREAISELETKLLDEKNPLLRRVYQSDLHIWKERLLAWEYAVKLTNEVLEFKNKISQPENCVSAWADEKNIAALVSALLDLHDIPSEIFALLGVYKNSKQVEEKIALGEIFTKTLENISGNLPVLSDKGRKSDEILTYNRSMEEWRDYFGKIKTWLDEQIKSGQAFMLKLDTTIRIESDMSNNKSAEFKADAPSQ